MSKFIKILLAGLLATSCIRPYGAEYLDFMYESMPLPDSLTFDRDYWKANVNKTLEVREFMDWNIPEREFRHFVLPLRVNNENLDDFRLVYADSLCARVKGMSMEKAALEINHWCHERATYVPSDGRTLGPMALIRSGQGRCGEESVLTVAALRAAGIPARQVYTPRWAHTDDNHAWVEVFVGGKWHFMGACEPEPVLDLGWFNSSVSRAMLLHTKVFGHSYDGPEDVISRTSAYTEINCVDSYIPSRRTTVTVRDTDGKAVPGARVEFKIYNYAELYTVASYVSDDMGQASLTTGLGDIVVWACDGRRFGLAVAGSEHNEVILDKILGNEYVIDLDITPPADNPLPDNATEQQKEENQNRLYQEDMIRTSRPHPRTEVPELFLSDKDAIDVPTEVVFGCVSGGLTGDRYIDSPRVELEMLMPLRAAVREDERFKGLKSPSAIADWVRDNIAIDTLRNPQGLRIPPAVVLRSQIADARSRDIFFVAMCRALGFAARLDEATHRPEYRNGARRWVAVDFENDTRRVPQCGTLVLDYVKPEKSPVVRPEYYGHYTLSRIENCSASLYELDENAPTRDSYSLEAGYYMLTSGIRLWDGSVLARISTINIKAGSVRHYPLTLRDARDKIQVIGHIDPETMVMPYDADGQPSSLLSFTGRGYFMICITGDNDEPTIHAIKQLEKMAGVINGWERPVVVMDGEIPSGLDNMIHLTDYSGDVYDMLGEAVSSRHPLRLPVIAVADSFGKLVYLSQGYNTSLQSQLQNVLDSTR